MTSLTTRLIVLVGGLLLAVVAWSAWRERRASGEREAALRALTVTQGRADELAARLAVASRAVAPRIDTVRVMSTRWRTVAGSPSSVPPRPQVDTSTNVDTLRGYVAALLAHTDTLRAAGDSLERACTALANDCEALRVRADSLPALLRQLRQATERAVKAAPPRRRWSPLGCSAPGAVTQHGFALGAACGVTYSL